MLLFGDHIHLPIDWSLHAPAVVEHLQECLPVKRQRRELSHHQENLEKHMTVAHGSVVRDRAFVRVLLFGGLASLVCRPQVLNLTQ